MQLLFLAESELENEAKSREDNMREAVLEEEDTKAAVNYLLPRLPPS